MATWKSFVASLGIAAGLSLSSVAIAQQANTISNKELLERIEQLEAELQADRGLIRNASHEVGEDVVSAECGECVGGASSGFYAVYENVIVKPHFTRDTAYNIVDPNGFEGYEEHSFDWDYGYSGRIELGALAACDCLGVRARYWRFDNDTSLRAVDDNSDIYAGFGEDSTQIGFDGVSDASFTRTLEMDVLDLEVGARQCNCLYSGGVRYARMEQTYDGVDNTSDDVFFSGHDFEGLGLTTALEFSHCWCGGWSVFAKTRGSLLYGSTSFYAVDPDDEEAFLQQNDNDMIAAAELQLGVDWRTILCSGRIVFASVAAETQYWFNAGTGAATSNAPYDELNYQNGHAQDADLGFVGLNLGLGMMY